MRIPERDVTCIISSVYWLTLIHRYPLNRKHGVNLIQRGFELERNFARYIEYIDVWIADLYWALYIISTG